MSGYSDTYEDEYVFYADIATLPVAPTFVINDTDITKLQQLSQAVSFIIDDGQRPTWHLYKTAVLSVTSNVWTNVSLDAEAFDSSGVTQGGGLVTIVTTGYYATEGCCQVSNGASQINFRVSFLFTAGANNPHQTNGTLIRYGMRGGGTESAGTTVDSAITTQDICPVVCYPGDTIQFQARVSNTVNINKNINTTYSQGRFVVNFTGQLVRLGT